MALKALLLYDPRKAHQKTAMQAFAEGLRCHGHLAHLVTHDNLRDRHDFIVTWGDKGPREIPRLCLEAGYINDTTGDYVADRLRFISVGWNGLHNHADAIYERPATRWRELGLALAPWKTSGRYVLVLEQYPTDSGAPRAEDWQGVKTALRRLYGDQVRVRPHPLASGNTGPLAAALEGAWLAVTWASTAAVEAVIAGVPTITLDPGAIAWPVAGHSLYEPVYTGPREQWAYNLAYRQFRLSELSDGTAWEYIGDATRQTGQNRTAGTYARSGRPGS